MVLPRNIRQQFRKFGRQGGKKTLDTFGLDHFRRIGRISAAKRIAKKKEEQEVYLNLE